MNRLNNNKSNYLRLSLKRMVLFAALLFLLFANLHAQESSSKLLVSTDRNLYVVNEKLNIKLMLLEESENRDYKTYVYCDLIGQDGDFYVGAKVLLKNNSADLSLIIPEELGSGNYILRSYTQAMLGYQGTYSYHWLRVVNPKMPDLLSVQKEGLITLELESFTKQDGVRIDSLPSTIAKRSLVKCSLNLSKSNLSVPSISISVVPKVTTSAQYVKRIMDEVNMENNSISNEGGGLIIHGKLNASKSTAKKELSNRTVFFSIRGTKDVFSCITDSLGYFQSNLPDVYGMREVYITTGIADENVSIQIDRDFDNQTSFQFEKEFMLSEMELKEVLKLAQNNAVNRTFIKKDTSSTTIEQARSFYDKPDETVVIHDYIDLDNLSQYFTELPGNVHLHKVNGEYDMRILSPQGMQLFLAPLIMVDYVVVNDLKSVLNMDPKGVNRIEVVRDYYQKGDAAFGGIVNFITNKNDFNAYKFSSSSVSISFKFLSPNECDKPIIPNDRSPDARNTLLWLTTVKPVDNIFSFEFNASDTKGVYSVIIQGIDANGKRIYYSKDFTVE